MNFIALLLLLLLSPGSVCIFTDFDLVRPWRGAWGSDGITPYIKIDGQTNNGPNCSAAAAFGYSVAVIGDLDGNGVDDIVVGAIGENAVDNGDVLIGVGGVYVMFMNNNGSVIRHVHISHLENGGPRLTTADQFGYSVAALGDLDGDSIPDIAVGAPAVALPSVYVLYLKADGTARDYTLIRGDYGGGGGNSTIVGNASYIPNGPPIFYGSRFGTAVTALSDMDGDGVIELAVSSINSGGGLSRVFIIYITRNSTMKSYTEFGPGVAGGPNIPIAFTGFGASLLIMPDFDGDNISELVVGARFLDDPGSVNRRAGKSYFCFLNANGTVKSYTEHGEWSISVDQAMPNVVRLLYNIEYTSNLHYVFFYHSLSICICCFLYTQPLDECGASLATIGDINKDNYKQRRPTEIAYPLRPSVPDFIMGCPQGATGNRGGRFFLMFLTSDAELQGFANIPADTDLEGQGGGKNSGPRVAPPLQGSDQFGESLAGYEDLDANGLREILVGAPGSDILYADGTTRINAGAVYIIFLRRRRHFWIPFDFVSYILSIVLPLTCFCCSCIGGTVYFFWYFRRRPDEVEVIVKKSGYEMRKERQRYQRANNQVYADNYTA